jgi:hypothetical protein
MTRQSRFTTIRSFLPFVIAALITVPAFLWYYQSFVAAQSDYIVDRGFRALAVSADQIGSKIATLAVILPRALQYRASDYAVSVFLHKLVPELTVPALPCENDNATQNVDVVSGAGGYLLKLRAVLPPNVSGSSTTSTRTIKSPTAAICATTSIKSLVGPILSQIPDEYFEHLVITDAAGSMLYQRPQTAVRIANLKSVLRTRGYAGNEKPPKPTDGEARWVALPLASADFQPAIPEHTALQDVEIAGEKYKAFFQPIPVAVAGNQSSTGGAPAPQPKIDLIICGFLRNDKLTAQSASIPPGTTVFVVVFIMLIFFLSWPVLKIPTMGRTERLRRRHPFLLATCITCGTTVLSLTGLHLIYSLWRDQSETTAHLSALAKDIDRKLSRELDLALQSLTTVSNSALVRKRLPLLHPIFVRDVCQSEQPYKTDPDPKTEYYQETDFLTQPLPYAFFPYFDYIFWTDNEGAQRLKLGIHSQNTQGTRICNFDFFERAAKGNHLWKLTVEDRTWDFIVEPLHSPATGEYLATISTPMPYYLSPLRVGTIVAPLISMQDAVMPPGFGFAIIDDSGTVVFHSNPSHNGTENLFRECRHDSRLRSAVASRFAEVIDVDYLGLDHSMLVHPLTAIEHSPWTLVVFSDRSPTTLMYIEILLLAGALMLVFGAVLAVAVWLFARDAVLLVWPRNEPALYFFLFCLQACNIALLIIWSLTAARGALFFGILAIPALGVLTGIFRLRSDRKKETLAALALPLSVLVTWIYNSRDPHELSPWQWPLCLLIACFALGLTLIKIPNSPSVRPRYVYQAAVVALFVLVGVAPSFGCYKVSYDYVRELFLRRDQLGVADKLVQREAKIERYYRNVLLSDELPLTRSVFLLSRLNEDMDRFDTAFLNSSAQIYATLEAPSQHRVISWLLGKISMPFLNASGAALDMMAPSVASDRRWAWCLEGPSRIQLIRPEAPAGNHSVQKDDPCDLTGGLSFTSSSLLSISPWQLSITSELPSLHAPTIPEVITFVAIVAITAIIVRLVVRALFLEHEPVSCWQKARFEQRAPGQVVFVVGLPASGKSRWLKTLGIAIQQTPDLLKLSKPPSFSSAIIGLDHFEVEMRNAEANNKKLEILERWVFVEKKQVIVVTTIDPFYCLFNESPVCALDRNVLERWRRMAAISDTKAFVTEPDDALAAADEATLDLVWDTCTEHERLVLYQLAMDGWANPRNLDAIDHLQKRGLITRTEELWREPQDNGASIPNGQGTEPEPVLPLRPLVARREPGPYEINGRFRRHVLKAADSADVRRWKEAESRSYWPGIKLVLWVVGVLLVLIIMYSERSFFQSWPGFLTGLAGLVPVAAKFVADVRQKRNASQQGV